MSAEELDKLFRDKLKNKPVTPSADAWERLQARMQPPVQQERKPVMMWYYSAAAAVILLLGIGFWVINQRVNPLQPTATVATVQQPVAKAPVILDSQKSAAVPAQAEERTSSLTVGHAAGNQKQMVAVVSGEKKSQNQATIPTGKASNQQTKETKMLHQMPATVTPAAPSGTLATAPVVPETTDADVSAPLEIIVKLDHQKGTVALAPVEQETTPAAEELSGTKKVLKGLFKQVKNLRDGEKINLAELGITKHTLALETQIGNKKISKTIQL